LDEVPVVPFDPGGLQADAVGVRGPAGRNQEVRSLDHAVRRMQPYGLAGSPLHARDGRGRQHLDPLVVGEFPQRFRAVAIFAVTSVVLGPTKRPCPLTSSAPLSRYALTFRATMPSTIFRLRSRTAGISTFQSPAAMPNSAPLRK